MQELLSWLDGHQYLSGWAQAFGGILGVVIAIAIPYFQRASQITDEKIKNAREELAQSQGVYFLVSDTLSWLVACKVTATIPRKSGLLDRAPDLLSRALVWETKESEGERVVAIHATRDVIVRTNGMLNLNFKLEQPLASDELEFLEKDLKKMKALLKVRHDALLVAEQELLLSKAPWFRKPLLQYQFKEYRALKNNELDIGLAEVFEEGQKQSN